MNVSTRVSTTREKKVELEMSNGVTAYDLELDPARAIELALALIRHANAACGHRDVTVVIS